MRIQRLTQRSDFLHAAKAAYQARPNLIVQCAQTKGDAAGIRVGFTATKKIGGAVVRNRAKRRLRMVAARLLPEFGLAGRDYVFIARASTPECPFEGLLDDAKSALIRLSRNSDPSRSLTTPTTL